jgi:ABC-type polysaccharide/polyol phosphate export permease
VTSQRSAGHFLRHNLDLLQHLVRRDFLLTYRRSTLGMLWSLVLPLAQLLVLGFVFQHVLPLGIEAYPAFLFCALLPWAWFSTSVLNAAGLFITNRDLLRRPNFGPGLLVLVSTLSNLMTYVCALPVLVAVLYWYGRPLHAAIWMLPVVIAIQALLTVGIGLIVATLNVFYRDVNYVVTVILMLLFYVTPVFYRGDASMPGYAVISVVNPLAGLVQSYRDIFFDGIAPPFGQLALSAAASVVVTAIGYRIYRSMHHDLIDAL